jgi:hypothetical protein
VKGETSDNTLSLRLCGRARRGEPAPLFIPITYPIFIYLAWNGLRPVPPTFSCIPGPLGRALAHPGAAYGVVALGARGRCPRWGVSSSGILCCLHDLTPQCDPPHRPTLRLRRC